MPNAAKNYFNITRGINTDAPLVAFPDGFSTDEQNYELLTDGSRRRRKGLNRETGGAAVDMTATDPGTTPAYATFKWRNAGSVPQNDYIVIQTGRWLRVFQDTDPVSTNNTDLVVDLLPFKVSTATDAEVTSNMVDMSSGRGHLLVTGKYIDPFYCVLDITSTPNTLTPTKIDIQERDFEGADDGYSNTAIPTTDIATHRYNLLNRGWTNTNIDAFETSQNFYPSKNMIPWLGLKRGWTSANTADPDGTRTFAPDKLVAELFQDATAPMGHFLRNPFDTSRLSIPGASVQLAISNWTINSTNPNGVKIITITTAATHGLAVSDYVQISGQYASFLQYAPLPDTQVPFTFNVYTQVQSVPTSTTFTIYVQGPNNFDNWNNGQYISMGTVNISTLSNPTGITSPVRPKVNAFFCGRAFYAGCDYKQLASKIFFTQVIESDAQYSKCYQVADPTDERISDLVDTDGGVINIPEASEVVRLLPYGSSLLVFATNGIWEIGPGQSGYFSATSYSVRKITDIGCVSGSTVVLVSNTPIYWGMSDIFAITVNQYTNALQATNLSENIISGLYNGISRDYKINAQGAYDDSKKQAVWLYNSEGAYSDFDYRRALVFDIDHKAFVVYTFGVGATGTVKSVFSITPFPDDSVPKLKFVTVDSTGLSLDIMALIDTTFADLGSNEEEAYIVTAYDSLGDPASKQYAPYITVFQRKTETGYTVNGDQYTPINGSSTFMQARWDWADRSNAGKWGNTQEVYRRARLYIPSNPATDTFDDGIPLVITNNRVRGSGRTLQLKFSAGTAKDSWLQGWKIYYTKGRR